MRPRVSLQRAPELALIPVKAGSQAQKHRPDDHSLATAELRRVLAMGNRPFQHSRRPLSRISARRRQKAASLIVFALFAVVSVCLKVASPGELGGLYFGLGAVGWLPIPRPGPWSGGEPDEAAGSKRRQARGREANAARPRRAAGGPTGERTIAEQLRDGERDPVEATALGELTRRLVQRALVEELTEHLGYPRHRERRLHASSARIGSFKDVDRGLEARGQLSVLLARSRERGKSREGPGRGQSPTSRAGHATRRSGRIKTRRK